LAEPGKPLGLRLKSALTDSLLAGVVAFALFSLVLGLRTVDGITGLTLQPRPDLLAIAVGIVFVGRFLLNLFVWQTEYPLTTPFAKLFTRDAFDKRDITVLSTTAALGVAGLVMSAIFNVPALGLIAGAALLFVGLGLLRRLIVHVFPDLPYAQIFIVGGILFAIFFPLTSYALDRAFNLGLPLRYWFDLSILVLTYVMLGWGLNIVVGLAGLLDLGYVAFYAVGAYTFALLATHFGLGFWICLPIAGLAAALWGVILGFPVLRLRGDYLAIVTLAFGEIIRIVLLNWTEVTNGPNGISGIPKPTFFGLPFSPFAEGTTFASFFGLKYDALHGIMFLYYLILVLAFLTSAIILSIVVLGGMGSQLGVAIAAVVMVGGFEALRHTDGLQSIFGAGFDPALYRMLLFGIAMVGIMIWRPRGLIASRSPTISLNDANAVSGDLVRQGRR
jgi:branched-chain amino acid transport system permease protein